MNAIAATAARFKSKKQDKEQLPAPLVKPVRHPLKWTMQRVELLGAAAVFTYIGILIVAALYYLIFQTTPFMKNGWHNLVPEDNLRHNIRDVGEGLLGGLLAQMIIWNHWKKKLKKKPNFLDRLEFKLHIPNPKCDRRISGWQLAAVGPLVVIYGAFGFFLTEWIISHVHYTAHVYAGGNLLDNIKNGFAENWPKKVIGYGAAFLFGRRPARGVFDGMQLWFAERRFAAGKTPRFYHMPTFTARYNWVAERGVLNINHVSKAQVIRIRIVIGVCAGLSIFGYYVLNYIAKGHPIHL